MKKMFMMMLLSIVSWTGAVTAAEATAPLKSNGPVGTTRSGRSSRYT